MVEPIANNGIVIIRFSKWGILSSKFSDSLTNRKGVSILGAKMPRSIFKEHNGLAEGF